MIWWFEPEILARQWQTLLFIKKRRVCDRLENPGEKKLKFLITRVLVEMIAVVGISRYKQKGRKRLLMIIDIKFKNRNKNVTLKGGKNIYINGTN